MPVKAMKDRWNMFDINDIIVYDSGGVCRIENICTPGFVKSNEKYYEMTSISEMGSTIYLKITNDKVTIRPVISREEAQAYLEEADSMVPEFSEIDKVREKEFQNGIRSCNCREWLSMLKWLLEEKTKKLTLKKRLNSLDDRSLTKVNKLLTAEFSVAFGISIEEAKEKIKQALNYMGKI